MGSPVALYQEEMHERIGFFANWLPADPLEVGWAGFIEGGRFRQMASLKDLGIPFEVSEAEHDQDVQFASSSGVRLVSGAGAGVATVASASLNIEFSRSGAFIFHAQGLKKRSLAKSAELANGLLDAYSAGAWDRKWRLIDGLHVARRATILVSEGNAASLELKAKVDSEALSMSLADPRVGLKVLKMQGTVFHAIARHNLHPLFSCVYVKDSLFGAPSVQPVRGTNDAMESAFTRPTISELVNG